MPIARVIGRERPNQSAERQSALYRGVCVDIHIIVTVHEFEVTDRLVNGGNGPRQTQADDEVLPPVEEFTHFGEITLTR